MVEQVSENKGTIKILTAEEMQVVLNNTAKESYFNKRMELLKYNTFALVCANLDSQYRFYPLWKRYLELDMKVIIEGEVSFSEAQEQRSIYIELRDRCPKFKDTETKWKQKKEALDDQLLTEWANPELGQDGIHTAVVTLFPDIVKK